MHTHTLSEIVPPDPTPIEERPLPAFGARAAVLRDQIYWFGTRGLIFTSPWVNTPRTRRQTAVLLLTVSGKPLELTWNGRRIRHDALAIAPLTQRGLRAIDVGLVSVNVQPGHPAFGALCRMTRDGVIPLSRAAYTRFDTMLLRAYEGRLPHRESERLFEALVETTVGELRASIEEDDRADRLHRLLARNPACTLEDVARELNVSYSGASHVFSRTIGLPLRSYQHWLKCMRAEEMFAADVRLTEIAEAAGFTDLPHLSRTWQRNFGMAPSYVRDSQNVRIVA
jgi:AraC-like DNA-binding protein